MNFGWNWPSGYGEDVTERVFFPSLVLVAILRSTVERNTQFRYRKFQETTLWSHKKSAKWSKMRCHLNFSFLFIALASVLVSGSERCEQFRKRTIKETFLWSLVPQKLRRKCRLKLFLLLWRPFCVVEQIVINNIGRTSQETIRWSSAEIGLIAPLRYARQMKKIWKSVLLSRLNYLSISVSHTSA